MQIPCPRDHVCRTGVTFPLGENPPRCTAAQMDLPEAQRNCMESCSEWWFEGMFGREGWNKKVSTATVFHHAAATRPLLPTGHVRPELPRGDV